MFFVKHPICDHPVKPFCGYTTENLPVLWYKFTGVEPHLKKRTAEGQLVQL